MLMLTLMPPAFHIDMVATLSLMPFSVIAFDC